MRGDFNFGFYLTADDLHRQVCETNVLDMAEFGISSLKQTEWQSFWQAHGLKEKSPLLAKSFVDHNRIVFNGNIRSYESAVLCDVLRHQLLKADQTLSFETVFSHPSKLDFMRKANEAGYRCYLYFSAVSSDQISVNRVRQRTLEGGHDVPEEKIRSRYQQSLENLLPALQLAYRSYLFDNSKAMTLVAEVDQKKTLKLESEHVSVWLDDYVLSRLPS